MISRRLLRIKVLQASYAFFNSGTESLDKAEKELFFSIGKTYELYLSILMLLIDLNRYARKIIDYGKTKFSPTFEDLNPNTKFCENRLIFLLENSPNLSTLFKNNTVSWANYPELIKAMYNQLVQSDIYISYMREPNTSFDLDKKFINTVLCEIIMKSEELDQVLEERSIYWNDDLEFAVHLADKSIKKADESAEMTVFPMFKDDEDVEFVKRLFRHIVLKHKEYEKLIDRHTKNWDVERIAFMDILIMELAIAEIVENETIPIRVSFNEYIEIAKYYSTQKSSNFINGILDKVISQLKEENRIVKKGRGLIGEISD